MPVPGMLATFAAVGSLVTSVKSGWELRRMVRRKQEQYVAEDEAPFVFRRLRRAHRNGLMDDFEYEEWYEKFLIAKAERDREFCSYNFKRTEKLFSDDFAVVGALHRVRAHLKLVEAGAPGTLVRSKSASPASRSRSRAASDSPRRSASPRRRLTEKEKLRESRTETLYRLPKRVLDEKDSAYGSLSPRRRVPLEKESPKDSPRRSSSARPRRNDDCDSDDDDYSYRSSSPRRVRQNKDDDDWGNKKQRKRSRSASVSQEHEPRINTTTTTQRREMTWPPSAGAIEYSPDEGIPRGAHPDQFIRLPREQTAAQRLASGYQAPEFTPVELMMPPIKRSSSMREGSRTRRSSQSRRYEDSSDDSETDYDAKKHARNRSRKREESRERDWDRWDSRNRRRGERLAEREKVMA
ncbi:hypothetical protein B0H66DRAFT_41147 [Apodospora peruviana]|uniref:Uncharacterized protein n=1 Tax=Apodospora peruviana TaxID=516989 RepID=A0AAE0IRW6_9PEZI|nr:hypothetical protein B0H66DRAFT_41147 [Apodospora peruviana]